jgi:hypothetical protein
VPLASGLLSTLGASTGLYSFLRPGRDAAELLGIRLPPGTLNSNSEAASRQRAYICVHGIRNFASGVGGLSLLLFWWFSPLCRSSAAAAKAVQKAQAILMGVGAVVGIADGLVLSKYLESAGLSPEAKKFAEEKRLGHFAITLPVLAVSLSWWYM